MRMKDTRTENEKDDSIEYKNGKREWKTRG